MLGRQRPFSPSVPAEAGCLFTVAAGVHVFITGESLHCFLVGWCTNKSYVIATSDLWLFIHASNLLSLNSPSPLPYMFYCCCCCFIIIIIVQTDYSYVHLILSKHNHSFEDTSRQPVISMLYHEGQMCHRFTFTRQSRKTNISSVCIHRTKQKNKLEKKFKIDCLAI